MKAKVYEDMLHVMIKRGGPYAGADIPEFYQLMEALFSPEEAEINNILSRNPIHAADVAKQIGKRDEEVTGLLEGMVDRGLCACFTKDGKTYYQGVPFMPGIFEYQFIGGGAGEREKSVARLIHAYKAAYNTAKGDARITFPVTRVIPVDRKIPVKNAVHTYDQVASYIEKYDPICVGSCYCRHAARLRGEDVHDLPVEVCMWFGKFGEFAADRLGGRRVSKQEAMGILAAAEEAGLVHMSRNTTDEIEFMCNCDRWHCDVVKGVLKQPKPGLVFNSGFQPHFDPEKCIACETCIGRCPSGALTLGPDQVPAVNLDRCFGCAVCATGCEQDAIAMEAKPGFPEPPKSVKDLITALKASSAAR
ncbi:MAG: 4Fe-4S binding protein [Thermodesulfobacteriota bacterium]